MNGSTARNRLAKIPIAGDGAVDPDWNPDADGFVSALAVSGSNVYAGGEFTTLNGSTTRNRLAKIPTAGVGTVDPDWNPNANSAVDALAVLGPRPLRRRAVHDDRTARRPEIGLAKIPTAGDGTVDPDWNPNADNRGGGAGRYRARKLYVGGHFTTNERLDDAETGWRKSRPAGNGTVDPNWNPDADGYVAALAVSGSDPLRRRRLHDDRRLDDPKPAREDSDGRRRHGRSELEPERQ